VNTNPDSAFEPAETTMALIDVDALLAPVSESQPGGPDLEYDADFLALEDAARGKAEQQFGDTIIAAEEPDWRKVQSLALALLARSKDLRVAMHLLRASTHLQGLQAAAEGLQLVHGLLNQHWGHVHPLLDADDNNDPTMRLNALAPLADAQAFMADVRKASLISGRAGITGRDFELSAGKAQPHESESVIPPAGMAQALHDAEAAQPGVCAALGGLAGTVSAIDTLVNERASFSGPDLRPLRLLLQTISEAASQASAAASGTAADQIADVAAASADGATGAAPTVLAAPGALRTREDAIAALDKVCDWLERNEPSNPAPMLIRRAQRLINMNFLDILREIVPDGVDQFAKLAGVPADQ
jgi:type VI secretion system protein ImpA